jgi:hypothetical protein
MIRIAHSGPSVPLLVCLGFAWCVGPPAVVRADPTDTTSAAQRVAGNSLESPDPTAVIDRMIAAGWQRAGVRPSELCDDATFIRRIFLDLVGRIPTPAERNEFLSDSAEDKRAQWVDRLLESPAHARHMADLFDALLLGRNRDAVMARRTQHGWISYLQESFAANRPWNQMARDIVLARATDRTDVRASWFMYERRNAHQEIAEAVAPAFFGIRIECAQCHDHPLASEIQQGHYWGLVAFFSRSENKETDQGPRVVESARGGTGKYTDLAGDSHETLLTFFESPVVDEPPTTDGETDSDDDYVAADASEPRMPKFSRRQQFADQILADHPLLSRALVNRLWALVLGRGLVHPYDRMDSMHPASHPELLDWLADDFRASGYDMRRLIRHLVRTRCYQLDTRPADDQALPEHFAYGLVKLLPAESLLRSITTALQGEATEPDGQLLAEFRQTFPDVLPEEPISNLSQALLLTNHPQFNRLFDASTSPVLAELVQIQPAAAQVDHVFLVALGREPDADERTQGLAYIESHSDPKAAVVQLMWALLASAEFRVNH